MGKDLDIEDVCHGNPLAREQLTALMEDNARLRAENAEMRKLLADVCPTGIVRVSESLDKKIRRFLSGEVE